MRHFDVTRLDIVHARAGVRSIAQRAERARECASARLDAATQTARVVTAEGVWASAYIKRVTEGTVIAGGEGQRPERHPTLEAIRPHRAGDTGHTTCGVGVVELLLTTDY